MKNISQICFLVIVGLFLASCTKRETTDAKKDPILAKVGDRVITANEFKYSYEFSFKVLRMGEKRQRDLYLDYMIKELMLANEGFRLGFNNHRYVTSRMERRKRNNLLEAFYQKYVHSRVKIPEEKLQESIKRGTVKWRMILWPTPTLQEAEDALLKARETNLENYIEKKIADQEIQLQDKRFFETDWIDFLDMRPEILEKIKDLPIGEVSTPIPFADGYVLAQILDINLHGVKVDELKAGVRRKQMYARLHDIAADSIVHSLMDSLITPQNVRVKGNVINQVAEPLYQWVQAGLPETQSINDAVRQSSDTSEVYIQQLRQLLDQPILTSVKGNKTVADYFNFLNYYRSPLNQVKHAPLNVFKDQIIMEIGRMLKDETFLEVAAQDGFADSAHIQQDLRIWEQKWTYDIYRYDVVKNLDVTPEEKQEFFKLRWRELPLFIAGDDTTRFYKYEHEVHNYILHEKHLARLETKLAKLKNRYPVWINEELLNQLELTTSPKTIQTSYFVRKNFSGEALVPTADMKWINF